MAPQNFSGLFLKVLHRPLTAPLVAKLAPPVAPQMKMSGSAPASTSVHVSDCCSICELNSGVCFFCFVCLSCVFMCRVCMMFTPTTSIAYYCFMISVLLCTSFKFAIKFLFYSSLMQFGDQCQKMQISWLSNFNIPQAVVNFC